MFAKLVPRTTRLKINNIYNYYYYKMFKFKKNEILKIFILKKKEKKKF
jgi:hypothetical protein